jgi:peptidoglycan/xylan/chitin deacetylase (PgdA/CDA1 family)
MTAGAPATISLTFDDGPDPRWTPAVLGALDRARARATFFVLTTQVLAHPGWLERIRAAGHAVGLHAHEHRRHTTLTPGEICRDADTALAVLARHDITPTVWRLPWGVAAPATAAIARDRDLELVHWTADTEDWRGIRRRRC